MIGWWTNLVSLLDYICKKSEGSEILPDFQDEKLAWQTFMDFVKNTRFLSQRQKESYGKAKSMRRIYVCVPLATKSQRGHTDGRG